MYFGLKVIVVMPAFNEGSYIDYTIRSIPRNIVDEIVVVDDGSNDNTYQIASSQDVVVVRHKENRGVGAALKTGFFETLRLGGDVAVVMAGDGQMYPGDLPNLLRKIRAGYDYVVGDRFEEYKPIKMGMPVIRAKASVLLSIMTFLVTGIHVRDPQSGYVAISAKGIKEINWNLVADRWGVHNDTLMMCSLNGLMVSTASVRPVYFDAKGRRINTHVTLRSLIPRHIFMFAKLFFFRIARIFRFKVVNGLACSAPS